MMGFLKDAAGDLSCRRLAFLATIPASVGGTLFIANKLINSGHPDLSIEIWNWFYVYSAFLGGFVSIDAIKDFILVLKGRKK